MKNIAISVIVPTYNRESEISRCINSIRAQSYPVSEIVIVDDGSTDGTGEVVKALSKQDPRIIYLWQQNKGASAARNIGLRAASGDYIAFQDSDDEWFPTFIESLLPFVGAGRVPFCRHRVIELDGSERIVPSGAQTNPTKRLLRSNFISTQTVLIGKELLPTDPFDIHLRRFQDWDLWLRLIERGVEFVLVDRVLAVLHRSEDSLSLGSSEARVDALRRIRLIHFKLFQKDIVGLSVISARILLREGIASLRVRISQARSRFHWLVIRILGSHISGTDDVA